MPRRTMLAKPNAPLTRSPLDVVSGRQREVAAVDQPVAVEQHQAFGGHDRSVPAGSRRGSVVIGPVRAGEVVPRPEDQRGSFSRRRASTSRATPRTRAIAESDQERRRRSARGSIAGRRLDVVSCAGGPARCSVPRRSRRSSARRRPAPRRPRSRSRPAGPRPEPRGGRGGRRSGGAGAAAADAAAADAAGSGRSTPGRPADAPLRDRRSRRSDPRPRRPPAAGCGRRGRAARSEAEGHVADQEPGDPEASPGPTPSGRVNGAATAGAARSAASPSAGGSRPAPA